MREEYFGNIYAKAEDNAGNVSDAIFAGFMFEQTEPVAEKTLTPDHWTNGTVDIDLSTDDNLSGVGTSPCRTAASWMPRRRSTRWTKTACTTSLCGITAATSCPIPWK